MFQFLYRVLCGFFLGLSVFAPGLSGAVIAIIMGVYTDIVDIFADPFRNLRKNIIWCIPIGIGVVLSGVVFVLLFDFLFTRYEAATYFLFVGLIAGNLPIVYQKIREVPFKAGYLVGGVAAFAVALALFLAGTRLEGAIDVEGLTAGVPRLLIGGLAAGASMLVPGMSVSMVLIVSGLYRQLLFAAHTLIGLDFTYLIPFALFAAAMAIGLVASSRLIKWVFETHPGLAYTMVFGFMACSILGLIIQILQLGVTGSDWVLGIGMLAVGLVISMVFVVLSRRMGVDDA